jgi:hypothetical protein
MRNKATMQAVMRQQPTLVFLGDLGQSPLGVAAVRSGAAVSAAGYGLKVLQANQDLSKRDL